MPSTNSEDKRPVSPWVYIGWASCGCVALLALAALAAWYIIGIFAEAMLLGAP